MDAPAVAEAARLYQEHITRLWNRVIPKSAVDIRRKPTDDNNWTYAEYLHPRKGWRRVSRKRMGI